MRGIKQIDIKNNPYYLFDDMINSKSLDPNLMGIGKISFKSTDAVTYNIRYVTMKSIDHVYIDSENPRYLIFGNVDRYIEESFGDKYKK